MIVYDWCTLMVTLRWVATGLIQINDTVIIVVRSRDRRCQDALCFLVQAREAICTLTSEIKVRPVIVSQESADALFSVRSSLTLQDAPRIINPTSSPSALDKPIPHSLFSTPSVIFIAIPCRPSYNSDAHDQLILLHDVHPLLHNNSRPNRNDFGRQWAR
jgi:hypothetical protein